MEDQMAAPHIAEVRGKYLEPEKKCVLCPESVRDMFTHVALKHKEIERRGDIFWLDAHHAIYKGKAYYQ